MPRLEPLGPPLRSIAAVREHIRAHRPALVEAALIMNEAAISRASWAALTEALSPWTIAVGPNYRDLRFAAVRRYLATGELAALRSLAEDRHVEIAIERYVEAMLARPEQTDPAVELRPPAAVLERLSPPGPLLADLGLARHHPGKSADADAIVVYAYLAGAGHASDLHFDRDGRHVFNVELIGRKRFVLFPPEAGPLLNPIMQFGGVRAREWSDAQRRDFIAYAGGCEVELEPGVALYMPPFYWHHIDYLEAAAGLGFRVLPPASRIQAILARIPANYLSQIAIAELLRRDDAELRERWVAALEGFVGRPVHSRRAYYEGTRALLLRCLAELDVDVHGGGSPVVDSLDFAAPMYVEFMARYLDDGPPPEALALAPGVGLRPIDGRHVALIRGELAVPVPLAVGLALLASGGRFGPSTIAADHPEIAAARWAEIIARLRALDLVVAA